PTLTRPYIPGSAGRDALRGGGVHAGRGHRTRRGAGAVDRQGALGENLHRVGGTVRELVEDRVVVVVVGVAGLVVAAVVRLAGLAAVDGGLLGRLELLGAGVQAAGRDAVVDEGPVVRAPVEGARRGLQAVPPVVVEEDLLDRARARRRVGAGALGV